VSPRPGYDKPKRQRKEIVALNHFSKHLTREEMALALVDADDTRAIQFANMLLDPEYARTSVGVIANKVGLTTSSVIDAYRKRKVAESTAIILKHAPEIMADVAEAAKARVLTCPTCEGLGTVEVRSSVVEGDKTIERVTCKPCLRCEQSGRVREAGDNNARKLVFESIGLIGQRGPLIDARSITVGGDDGLEETLKAIARRERRLNEAPVTIEGTPNGTD
jgi:hypothetical protein